MRKPVVAILGRPNVGKSTLFNRIIKSRQAIVDDQPGVTRDRKYAAAEWAGCKFDVLDTGGYVPASDDVFEQAIREQVNFAIEEADVICFVTDISVGITPIDLEISRILLRSGVPLVVAANKADNREREADTYDFYQLGMGEPMPISALGGRGVGDFLDAVIEKIPKQLLIQQPQDEEQPIQLAIIGRPNVGKSSYVNALLGKEKMIVTNIAGTTRDSIDTPFHYKDHDFTLIDTAGLRRRSRVKENVEFFSSVRSSNAIKRCDVAVLVIDAQEGLTDQDKRVLIHAADAGKGLILCVNKWDLVDKETNTARDWQRKMQDEVRELAYVPVIFISALNKQRIFKVMDVVVQVYEESCKKIQTADLNRFLDDAVQTHHPPAYGTKWVKINYVTQVAIQPPLFAFYTNEPKGIKENYRNYLENKLRQTFGFLGVPIRLSFRKKN